MQTIVKTFESFLSVNRHEPQPSGIDYGAQPETENYMFFGNLETIHRLTGELLKLDPIEVDRILKDGHNWASDHIATSKDDIEEVFNFLINEHTDTEIMMESNNKKMCKECGSVYESDTESQVCESCGSSFE
jgi:hypothetical protein